MLVKRLASVEAPGIFHLMFGSTILPVGTKSVLIQKCSALRLALPPRRASRLASFPALRLSRPRFTQAMAPEQWVRPRDARVQSVLVVAQLVMATV